jgi:hypothetical protein
LPSRSRTLPGGHAPEVRGISGTNGVNDEPALHDAPSALMYRSLQHDPSRIFV